MFPAPVKSAFASQINWTQWVTAAASLLAYFGFSLTAEQTAAVILVIQLVGNFYTWVRRTWFTTTITPSSEAVALAATE